MTVIFAAKWGKGEGESALEAPQISGARFFPYSEVKRITNNFAEENEIGVGGYGRVLLAFHMFAPIILSIHTGYFHN